MPFLSFWQVMTILVLAYILEFINITVERLMVKHLNI